jgi:hypothetical protein
MVNASSQLTSTRSWDGLGLSANGGRRLATAGGVEVAPHAFIGKDAGAVRELVGIESGVVSGVINLE